MMYEGAVYRPPSEARSHIIQTTIGCSHNKCTFCNMYKDKKFRIRNLEDIFEDLRSIRVLYSTVRKIFLADGNSLVMKTKDLESILLKIKEIFPECEKVGIYSAPKDILNKPLEDLRLLKKLGLSIAYLGVESGNDAVLEETKKGVNSEQMIEAGKKMVEAGIDLSVMIISGLGGKERWKEHAIDSAKVVSAINPQYVALLTLLNNPGTEMYECIKNGEMTLLEAKEVIYETKEFIENLEVDNCVFRSNHASNYVALGGVLNDDKELLLNELNQALKEDFDYKDERYRRF